MCIKGHVLPELVDPTDGVVLSLVLLLWYDAVIHWKKRCHWLKGLRQRQITTVMRGPGLKISKIGVVPAGLKPCKHRKYMYTCFLFVVFVAFWPRLVPPISRKINSHTLRQALDYPGDYPSGRELHACMSCTVKGPYKDAMMCSYWGQNWSDSVIGCQNFINSLWPSGIEMGQY